MKWLINSFDKETEYKEKAIEKMAAVFEPWGAPDDEDTEEIKDVKEDFNERLKLVSGVDELADLLNEFSDRLSNGAWWEVKRNYTAYSLAVDDEEKRDFLSHKTNMVKADIERAIKNGMGIYTDDESGFKEFFNELAAGGDDDEAGARYTWDKLEKIDGFRFDFYL